MVGTRVPERTVDDATSYLASVKNAFRGEPAKYNHFLKLFKDYKDQRFTTAILIASVEELFKDHQDLLPGFRDFLPLSAE